MRFYFGVAMPLARCFVRFIPTGLWQSLESKLKPYTDMKRQCYYAKLIDLFKLKLQVSLFKVKAQVGLFKLKLQEGVKLKTDVATKSAIVEELSIELRVLVRQLAGVSSIVPEVPIFADLVQEVNFLRLNRELLAPVFKLLAHKRVLFAGQAYYNAWYLSRALRCHGWKADVLNWDMNSASQIYYHGEDFSYDPNSSNLLNEIISFYVSSIYNYDVFHFSNTHGISFGGHLDNFFSEHFSKNGEIILLKELRKKIVYSNNGCLDGVSQASFSKWGEDSVCAICRWRNEPTVCCDERNLAWGKFRNSVADYQCLLGGNRADYNEDPRVHEVPQFYCLDEEVWHPEIAIPNAYRLPPKPPGTVWLYHAVGNKSDRSTDDGVNIKSSHVYLPLVDKLKAQGLLLELLEPTGIPNKEVRFLQAQADIFLDMLSYGWFGANAREAMMLGKPVICYIRPEWLESVREEIPEYAAELPVISATPDTVEDILYDLIGNPEKRREIGQRSRAFAVKWHSSLVAGHHFDEIYSRLLGGDPMLREKGLADGARF